MDKLTKRLREIAEHAYDHPYANLTPEIAGKCSEAADEIERFHDLLERAKRLLSVCSFDAPEDVADLDLIRESSHSAEGDSHG